MFFCEVSFKKSRIMAHWKAFGKKAALHSLVTIPGLACGLFSFAACGYGIGLSKRVYVKRDKPLGIFLGTVFVGSGVVMLTSF